MNNVPVAGTGAGDNPTFGFSPLGTEWWNKPELDASVGVSRYEIGESNPAQLHGDSHVVVHEMYADNGPDGSLTNRR